MRSGFRQFYFQKSWISEHPSDQFSCSFSQLCRTYDLHGISRYSMQLLDEIPMVWSSCAFIYCQHMVTSRWEHSLPGQGGLQVWWEGSRHGCSPVCLWNPLHSALPYLALSNTTWGATTELILNEPFAGDVWDIGVLHDLSSCDDTQARVQQSQYEVSCMQKVTFRAWA